MSLMEDWEVLANQYNTDQATAQKFWTDYYMQEKAVYEKMLTEPVEVEKGTVAELAEKYGMDVVRFGGFLDGINESLKTPNPVDTIVAESEVTVDIDLEKLYYNMVAAKADWLYNLPQWDALLTEERRKELVKDVHKLAEESKVAIRSIRRDANEKLKAMKKDSAITEDDLKDGEKEVQNLTDKYCKKADDTAKAKEKEIMEI